MPSEASFEPSSSFVSQAGALMVEVDWEARSKQKAMLNELLTRHLLTLDSIQAVAGETPPEVHRLHACWHTDTEQLPCKFPARPVMRLGARFLRDQKLTSLSSVCIRF
jgi:hypothetical protein